MDGAVGMVEMALERLNENHTVELDEERKAACHIIGINAYNITQGAVALQRQEFFIVIYAEDGFGGIHDDDAQPVVNSGSLY